MKLFSLEMLHKRLMCIFRGCNQRLIDPSAVKTVADVKIRTIKKSYLSPSGFKDDAARGEVLYIYVFQDAGVRASPRHVGQVAGR